MLRNLDFPRNSQPHSGYPSPVGGVWIAEAPAHQARHTHSFVCHVLIYGKSAMLRSCAQCETSSNSRTCSDTDLDLKFSHEPRPLWMWKVTSTPGLVSTDLVVLARRLEPRTRSHIAAPVLEVYTPRVAHRDAKRDPVLMRGRIEIQ